MNYAEVAPVSGPVPSNKQIAKRHYGTHPYFTKRSWDVVQRYISTFTERGDTVLDPYGGSGVTAVEALILDRRAIHVDLAPLANFIAECTAVAPVDIERLAEAFHRIKAACESKLRQIAELSDQAAEQLTIPYWYPDNTRLPSNADVSYVHELFTRRQLFSLAMLRHHIVAEKDTVTRNLLLFCFSATLAKTNRTFVSAAGRKESRGGSTVFSIYRYYIPPHPVELRVWDQFAMRFRRLLAAKQETNKLVDEKYNEDTFKVIRGSATQLGGVLEPESVDYIFTDPPYGAHIAYLDLTTMWDAWLQFLVSSDDRELEVIEGGDLRKSKGQYVGLLEASVGEMSRVLRWDRWLSIVFSHKDPAYWDTVVRACERAGLTYVNTAVQPVTVVWSMHKKKNPLKVLSGELILNFLKRRSPRSIAIVDLGGDAIQVVKNSAELTIVRNNGATTEMIYHDLVPALLEGGLLGQIRKKFSDITPLLQEEFDFSDLDHQWHVRSDHRIGHFIPVPDRLRFYLTDYLRRCEREGKMATFDDIVYNVMPNLVNGETPSSQTILNELEKLAFSADGKHWQIRTHDIQLGMQLPLQRGVAPVAPPTSDFHNAMIYFLAKLGATSGLAVHIGKRERGESYNGEPFASLSIASLPWPRDAVVARVEQIDCLWLHPGDTVAYAFEVEESTPITSAIERFMELLKFDPNVANRVAIVAPRRRRAKLDSVLKTSHFIGHPLYMENKLVYLFYDDVLKLYQSFVTSPSTREVLLQKVQAIARSPRITAVR